VRCDEEGKTDVEMVFAEEGFESLRAKTNLGMGRADVVLEPVGQEILA